jgi:hypothetical protein
MKQGTNDVSWLPLTLNMKKNKPTDVVQQTAQAWEKKEQKH